MSWRSLLLGAGNSRGKKMHLTSETAEWAGELVTVDMDPNAGVDVVHDLAIRPLPFANSEFDEIHAYDCLEHWGAQGDWRAWFDEMAEYHRLLKPGGHFMAIVPVGGDAFADPGHTRFFGENHFRMLEQKFYAEQIAARRPVTDYRWYWKLNFDLVGIVGANSHLGAILKKA